MINSMINTANPAPSHVSPSQTHDRPANLFGAFVIELCDVFSKDHPALGAAVSELKTPISPAAIADLKRRLTSFDLKIGFVLMAMLNNWCGQERYDVCAIVPGFQGHPGTLSLFVQSPESHCEAFLHDLAASLPKKRPAIDIAISLFAQDSPADCFAAWLEQLNDDQIRVLLAFLRLISWWRFT